MQKLARASLVIAVFAMAALVTQPLSSNTAPTTQQCESAWTDSGASTSCGEKYQQISNRWYVDTSAYRVSVSSGQCRVQVDCLKSDRTQMPPTNYFTGSVSDVSSLINCEGTLEISSC